MREERSNSKLAVPQRNESVQGVQLLGRFYLWRGEKSKTVHSDSSLLHLCYLVRQKLDFKFVHSRKSALI